MRKQKLLKICTTFFLALTTLFSTACSGFEFIDSLFGKSDSKVTYDGTHVYTAKETKEHIVKNGNTEYTIVIPENSSATLKTALDEFVWLFEKATGITLRSRKDGNTLRHEANTKYISLGETSLLETSGITIDKEKLGLDGLRIVSKDSNIYLVGGSDRGTLYAVYTFMQMNFNFEQYYKDCYEIDRGVSNVAFYEYDVTDIPDIPIRIRNYGIFKETSVDFDENQFPSRMRMDIDRDDFILPIYRKEDPSLTDYSAIFHNCEDYLWGLDGVHPEWFSTDLSLGQLCYTARGDEDEFKAMTEYCASKIQTSLKLHPVAEYPLLNTVTLTMEDGGGDCQCDACLKLVNKYGGTYAGGAIIFMNELGRLVEDWMAKEENAAYRRDDFKLIFFAYNNMTNAPCKWDKKEKKWVPIDDDVKLRHNVGVWVAPIDNLDNQSSIYAEINKKGKENIDAWAEMSDYLCYWMYSTNFSHYMYMYDSTPFYNSDGYQYLASRNCVLMFNQSQAGQTGTATAWHNLKAYLDAKLMWDSTLNVETLTNNWFNAMFREAAPIMRSYYDDVRAWKVNVTNSYSGYVCRSIYERINLREYWPLPLLNEWQNACKDAVEAVSVYKVTNPELYESIYDHIQAEWLSPAWIKLELWKSLLPAEERTALIAEFKEAVIRSNIKQYSEHNSLLADYIKTL